MRVCVCICVCVCVCVWWECSWTVDSGSEDSGWGRSLADQGCRVRTGCTQVKESRWKAIFWFSVSFLKIIPSPTTHTPLAKRKFSFPQAKTQKTPMLLLSPDQTLRHSAFSKVSPTKYEQRIHPSKYSKKQQSGFLSEAVLTRFQISAGIPSMNSSIIWQQRSMKKSKQTAPNCSHGRLRTAVRPICCHNLDTVQQMDHDRKQ